MEKTRSFGRISICIFIFARKASKDEMIEKLNTEMAFAKRQNTWFKRDKILFG